MSYNLPHGESMVNPRDKKWYNHFITVEPDAEPGEPAQPSRTKTAGPTPRSAAQTVRDIAAAAAVPAEPKFKPAVAASATASFDEIYKAAEIGAPTHGYTILKIAEMLRSEHIRNLPVEVKRSSILVALEAAGVKLAEVIEDAVRRDRALDGFERVRQKAVEELEVRKLKENQQIQAELDRLAAEHKSRIQANNDEVAKAKETLNAWRTQKQQEEQKIADAVSPFVTENPITTGAGGAAPVPPVKGA
jgi:NADH dehydrogenase/NADH:ubiquinone oxidoreductase subunit G